MKLNLLYEECEILQELQMLPPFTIASFEVFKVTVSKSLSQAHDMRFVKMERKENCLKKMHSLSFHLNGCNTIVLHIGSTLRNVQKMSA